MGAYFVRSHSTSLKRDIYGHRYYTLRSLVRANDAVNDGPLTIMGASGLPAIGANWTWGSLGEYDNWAFCLAEMSVNQLLEGSGEVSDLWMVEQYFSTAYNYIRCQDTGFQDPVSEPPLITGTFVRYTQEAQFDLNGKPFQNSSYEQYKGPQVEWDANRPSVSIQQNFLTLGLNIFAPMVDTVNDSPLWGLPARCIKLSNVTYTRQVYGICTYYYTIRYDFDIQMNMDTSGNIVGFDRFLLDHGTRVRLGEWVSGVWTTFGAINPADPRNYMRWKDANGENAETDLDGLGNAITASGSQVYKLWQKYPASNFFTLSIPASLDS